MAIYALFSNNISAKSGLGAPFSTAWCRIESINWETNRPFSYRSPTSSGMTEFSNVQLSKAIDGASVKLANNAWAGVALSYVNIAITDATSKTIIAFKLTNVILTSEQFTAADTANESISLTYKQIAMAVLTAGALDVTGWDVSAASSWIVPSTTFTLDATYGIKIG